jgi:hypothetical protein
LFRTKTQRHEEAGSRPQGRYFITAAFRRSVKGMKPLRGKHDIFVPLCLCAKKISLPFAAQRLGSGARGLGGSAPLTFRP